MRIRLVAQSLRRPEVLAYHWEKKQYAKAIESMVEGDPDDSVGDIAVGALAYFHTESKDPRLTALFLRKLRDEAEEPSVRAEAYEGLLKVWLPEGERKKILAEKYKHQFKVVERWSEWETWIDWRLVDERRIVRPGLASYGFAMRIDRLRPHAGRIGRGGCQLRDSSKGSS